MKLQKIDGRRARGVRTRNAIIEALLDLVADGDLKPTAQRVADQAGVSVRSVYQHFTDIEGLYSQAAERVEELADELAGDVDPGLALNDRIERFVAARTGLLDILMPFLASARLVEPESEILLKHRSGMEKHLRDETSKVFGPELSKVGGSQRRQALAALDELTSWRAWEHLLEHLGVRTARQVMRTGVESMLKGLRHLES